ncbi:MAG TPA: SpoIIE family protein phosphatase, partial [Polyangiaceae bacterium]
RSGDTSFLRELDRALRAAAEIREDVGSYQKLLTVLDRTVADRLPADSPVWQKANSLLHAARVLVSVVAERIPAGFKQRYEDFSLKIQRANRAIMTAGDFPALATAAARHLPEFGISSFYVCFYEGDSIPATSMRLVLAWEQGRDIELPPDGVPFSAGPLVPPEFAPADRWLSSVVFPLERSGPSPGYVVLEYGPREGFVYELLSQQLSAACSRIRLLERVVEEARRRLAADRERLEKEVRVAQRIQVGLLPRRLDVPGLSIAAILLRAAPVGGDYYDVLPVDDGAFISLGSVTGQGLATGLAMLMMQSAVSGLARGSPQDSPSKILPYVDAVLSDNIRQRMTRDERAGLTLVRYHADGRLTLAGNQAGVVVCTAEVRLTSRPPSPWRGWSDAPSGLPATEHALGRGEKESTYQLGPGDSFLLYTGAFADAENDGDASRSHTALERALARMKNESAQAIAEALAVEVAGLTAARRTDVAILVAKHHGIRAGGAT